MVFIGFFMAAVARAQVSYTANDTVPPYQGDYRPGVNPGYYGGNWDNFTLTDLAAGNPAAGVKGAGVKAVRGGLPESFALVWTYDAWRSVYDYYKAAGVEDNTLFVGYAHPDHRDTVDYCPGDPVKTQMFLNLYEPIWDDGQHGTPVNEHNYFAYYVYTLAQKFGDDVRFWEVWNEPGFDLSGYKSWLQPGQPGNWWENDPDPCDIIIRAPVQHFIRCLRITYEVVKSVRPDDYVVLAGVGNDSFLDVILRNTDNPAGGAVTADYPLKGGAYFDVMGYHIYPSIDGSIRKWNNTTQSFDYFRHSDAAVDGFADRLDKRQMLLAQYGYDGVTYPKKLSIVTEINVSRKKFGDSFGSDTLQRNYIIKASLLAMDRRVAQIHVFDLGERRKESDAQGEFDLMGLYQNLNDIEPYDQTINDEGIALRTFSRIMFGAHRDTALSAAMNLPAGVRGGAYIRKNGQRVYVLWAATQTDLSEDAAATYSFPATFPTQLYRKAWNYGETELETLISSQDIALDGSPVFFTEEPLNDQQLMLTCPGGQEIEVTAPESDGGAIVSWPDPVVASDCGNASISLTVGQAPGSFFDFGFHVIGYKATDDCGNEVHCAKIIKVASSGGGIGTCHFNRYNFHFSGTFRGHNYFQSKFKATYDEARQYCAQHGGYLTSIETKEENEFLRGQIFELAYVGLSDDAQEGQLVWASGEPLTYGEFDTTCTWCGVNTDANDYALFHPWDGKMSMADGTEPQYFLMEFPCRDCACFGLYEPVCGSDSVTYYNSCEAECAGIYVYHDGECVMAAGQTPGSAPVRLYPNPASTKLTIRLPDADDGELWIYDALGRPVWRRQVRDGGATFSVAGLPRGFYIVQIRQGGVLLAAKKLLLAN